MLVAARALWHTRRKSANEEARQDGGESATLAEFASKFNRAFSEIEKLGREFHEHDLDCVRAKTILAERQLEAAKAMDRVVDRVENLQKQMGYVGKDIADARLGARLAGGSTG